MYLQTMYIIVNLDIKIENYVRIELTELFSYSQVVLISELTLLNFEINKR